MTGEGGIPVSPLQAEAMLALLVEHHVEFVVIGGFALAAHGVVRGTKDVDIFPAPASENHARLANALEALGAEVLLAEDFQPAELGIEPDADGLALGGNWALRTRLGRLDVMQDVPGAVDYRSLAAGRPQDEIDVVSLERARRALD